MKNTVLRAGVLLAALGGASVEAGAQAIDLPAGTQLRVVLETTLTTQESKVGDAFRSRLVFPVFAEEQEALPIGTAVEGTVAGLQGPGRLQGKARIQLRPEKLILPDGRTFSLAASVTEARTGENAEVDPKEGTLRQSGKEGLNGRRVATGAALSAAMGAVLGGGRGAMIGAGAAGAVALLQQLFKRGKNADLRAGSEIVLELSRTVSIPRREEVPPADQPKFGSGTLERSSKP